MTAISDALDRYGATALGLALGTAAKYGLTIGDGETPSVRAVIADLLLLGMLGCIAITASDWMQLTGNAKVLAGALTAVSSDRLVRQIRARFEKRVLGAIDARLPGDSSSPPPPAV